MRPRLGFPHLLFDIDNTVMITMGLVGWLCWGLTSQSTIFQSCRDGAIASWVINQYFRGVKCLAQGHNTAAVGLEPRTSRSGVRHSTTEPPRSPNGAGDAILCKPRFYQNYSSSTSGPFGGSLEGAGIRLYPAKFWLQNKWLLHQNLWLQVILHGQKHYRKAVKSWTRLERATTQSYCS